MKRGYNRNEMSDIPLDASFDASTSVKTSTSKTTTKPKINAIGKKANSGIKNKTTKTETTSKKSKTDEKSKEALNDLERLNEENFRGFETKSKRNKVVIVLLVIAIISAIAVISVYLAITKLKTNCTMYVYGANASYVINGEELSEFRAPSNLRGNSIFEIDIDLKIESSGTYNIKFKPECYQNGNLIENTLIYEANLELFYEGVDGYYYSKAPIDGNQKIDLCGGIILDYNYKDTLTIENFQMKFHTYLEEEI